MYINYTSTKLSLKRLYNHHFKKKENQKNLTMTHREVMVKEGSRDSSP